MKQLKKSKRDKFKGISLEKKYNDRNEIEYYKGSKSGNKFIVTDIKYNG